MPRIAETFRRLQQNDEGALIGYLMAGDPSMETSTRYAEALLAGGVDVLELGVPFSDPIADGPTIQAADVRALEADTTPEAIFDLVRRLRRTDHGASVPIVLMTYYTPIFAMGEEAFALSAQRAGVDGVIVPDLPVEEAASWLDAARQASLDTVFLATPETDKHRLAQLAAETSGFLYLVGRYGVTGERAQLDSHVAGLIKETRRHIPEELPIAVGFGLSQPEHVRDVIRAGAQGAIVGSAIVSRIADGPSPEDLQRFVQDLKAATRSSHEATAP
mgnify:CR=1 FL=1